MIEDEELDQIEKEREEKQEAAAEVVSSIQKSTIDIVDESEQETLDKIKRDDHFQEKIQNLLVEAADVEFERRQLIVLDQKQKNELAKLQLSLNKKTMKEEASAQHYERKRKAKMIRFGYLYTPYEVEIINPETGELETETRYKNFTTNNFINHYKEFANFYANLADDTKRIISKTMKVIFWLSVLVLVGFSIYGIIKWILNSGFVHSLIENGTTEQIVRNIKNLML